MPSTAPPLRVAVAGNPNSGKTTLFNALTGLRLKVGNYPGVTVEKREGKLAGSNIVLLDLPGAYSLSARSPDEQVARDVFLGRIEDMRRPDGVLLVIDASNLERNLYLASQVLEFGIPVIIACNMVDVAEHRRQAVNCNALSKELGVPVIPTIGARGKGLPELRDALRNIQDHIPPRRTWRFSEPMETAITQAADIMLESGLIPPHTVRGGASLWLSDYLSGEEACRDSADAFLAKLTPEHSAKLQAAADAVANIEEDPTGAAIEARYDWIARVADRAVQGRENKLHSVTNTSRFTERIDRILTHRVFGVGIFAAIMFVLFLAIFSWAEPFMGVIETALGHVASAIESNMADGPVRSLIVDGIIKGVCAVLVFFPQICLLFMCMAILEDSGYMARAAFLMDRLMSHVGLHGRSFIPLLSSYACAIPGIMATRSIENRRDRFTTILVAPLMSCSARLPVYLILVAAVFGHHTLIKASVMFGLYVFGTIAALIMAFIFKKTLFAGPRPTFIMELPPYHLPRPSAIARTMWERSKLFLTGAGTIIFAACVVIWALSYFPRLDQTNLSQDVQTKLKSIEHFPQGEHEIARERIIASAQLKQSYIGHLGHTIEPVIEPLGYDWRIGIGLLSSFMAREAFVSTMGITFAIGSDADEKSEALQDQLATATWPDGRRVLTPVVGVGLLIFYVLACQCVSTLAIVRRETQSWRWPAFLFGYMTVLAYLGALLVYQIGSALGIGVS